MSAKSVNRRATKLEDLPNIGESIASDLRGIGIATPQELKDRDPYQLYAEIARVTGERHDPCLLDSFISAVKFLNGAPAKPWWHYTAQRKRELATRASAKGI